MQSRCGRRMVARLAATDQKKSVDEDRAFDFGVTSLSRAIKIAQRAAKVIRFAARCADNQMPSLALSRSLTACGLALPPVSSSPDDEQPSMSLGQRLRDLVRIFRDDVIDSFSISSVSVTASCTRFDDLSGRRLRSRRSRTSLGDLAGDHADEIRSTIVPSAFARQASARRRALPC